jgi:hypothetical protein
VLVTLVPDKDKAFEFTIFTPVDATPFIVVVNVLVEEEFEMLLTAFADEEVPFTTLVIEFPDDVKELAAVTAPFTKLPEASNPK